MFGWFDKWFQSQCEKAWNAKQGPNTVSVNEVPCVVREKDSIMDHRKSISFKMQTAKGGTIIEVSHYDTNRDEWERDLYIINENEDFAEQLSGIIVQHKLTYY